MRRPSARVHSAGSHPSGQDGADVVVSVHLVLVECLNLATPLEHFAAEAAEAAAGSARGQSGPVSRCCVACPYGTQSWECFATPVGPEDNECDHQEAKSPGEDADDYLVIGTQLQRVGHRRCSQTELTSKTRRHFPSEEIAPNAAWPRNARPMLHAPDQDPATRPCGTCLVSNTTPMNTQGRHSSGVRMAGGTPRPTLCVVTAKYFDQVSPQPGVVILHFAPRRWPGSPAPPAPGQPTREKFRSRRR